MSLFMTYALLFWYGSTLIKAGDINFESMMTAILCLMLGALGLGQALTDLADQKDGLKAAKRIFKTVEEGANSPIDGLTDGGFVPNERSKGRIELKNIFFKYPTRPKVEVCRDYNITIEPGEVVALVGPSGSGKSTIMNLLLRFYDPLEGQVLLDGKNIRDVNVKWLRDQIGYVGQEPVLFSGTIADNIGRGRELQSRLKEESSLVSIDDEFARVDFMSAFIGQNLKELNGVAISKRRVGDSSYEKVPQPNDIEAAVSPSSKFQVSEDIIHAAKLSNAHEFIETFPAGYLTDVGESSMMVSGGQKQRIAIARALIRRPAVLLLGRIINQLRLLSNNECE